MINKAIYYHFTSINAEIHKYMGFYFICQRPNFLPVHQIAYCCLKIVVQSCLLIIKHCRPVYLKSDILC